jgi:hypothetical protein
MVSPLDLLPPTLSLALCPASLFLSLSPPPPSDRRSTAGSPASSPPPSPAWRPPGPSSGARRLSRPWRRCPGRGRRRSSPGAARPAVGHVEGGLVAGGQMEPAGLRCGMPGGAQQPQPHRLGAVVHRDQLDAATGSILKKKKQCVIPFRRVDSCALGEGRRRGHRRRREENSSPALSSCVPLRFFYPSFSRPLALIGPCRHCATHSFLIAVGAGLLAYRWYGCFFLLSFASGSSKFSVRQDY